MNYMLHWQDFKAVLMYPQPSRRTFIDDASYPHRSGKQFYKGLID